MKTYCILMACAIVVIAAAIFFEMLQTREKP